MNESTIAAPADELIALLRKSLTPSGAGSFGHLVLYTSFGVVRGRTGLAFSQETINKANGEAETNWPGAVIALNDVTVEHYSNHLASATFDRLYVKLSDVQGFALVGNQGQ
jgi:hypothetical protein